MSIPAEDRERLRPADVDHDALPDWRLLFAQLVARFETGSFSAGVKLVSDIAAAADREDHHPDVDLRYPWVEVRLTSHDVDGLTRRDLRLARVISEIAARAEIKATTADLQSVELGLDTWDAAEIRPFWAAVLGLSEQDLGRGHVQLRDDAGRWATVWFQEAEQHEAGPQRWHPDVRVPPEQAEARVRAALDAGGTLVSDEAAPRFWVLADPQGNQACLTTWQGREGTG